MTKTRLGLMPVSSGSWWSLTAQAKGPFHDSKELKMN